MQFIEYLKALFLGIVEGITEWLPISSTGHMLLVDEFLHLNVTDSFKNMFLYVIQLGAILAVVLLFWKKMWPFGVKEKGGILIKKDIFTVWFKVVLACVPGTVVTLLFDDWIEAHFSAPVVIALALIVYGVAFIVIEGRKKKKPRVRALDEISWRDALYIGLFQVLSVIPGTSRSGATILGALLIGVSRVAAAEFTFFLAVPVMFGMSAIKLLSFDFAFQPGELGILLVGTLTAFFVSLACVKFLMNYIKKHDFRIFGAYRILLGIVVLLVFLVIL